MPGHSYPRQVSVDDTWALGSYERTAPPLLPAAVAAVDAASPGASEHVLDLGCGTGNAALLAAERGARVTAVDPAGRLLEIAARRAHESGLTAAWCRGDAASIPLEAGSVDVVVSVFGVIFASDPVAAAAEMARVCAPRGRLVLTAWLPEGALGQLAGVRAGAVGAKPRGGPPFPWHEREALVSLLEPHGFSEVHLEQRDLPFTAASAEAFLEAELRDHPLWVAAAPELEAGGRVDDVRRRALEVLESANEDPGAFRVTSRYVVALAQRYL
jgi:SAM-dependent methyltransferase